MNRERAESYLRALAEAELRRATGQSWGGAQWAGHAARITKVAQVLAFVGALDAEVADQILGDFELALGTRQTGQISSAAGWFPRRAVPARSGAGAADRLPLHDDAPGIDRRRVSDRALGVEARIDPFEAGAGRKRRG
jgi:hypothetical protein